MPRTSVARREILLVDDELYSVDSFTISSCPKRLFKEEEDDKYDELTTTTTAATATAMATATATVVRHDGDDNISCPSVR